MAKKKLSRADRWQSAVSEARDAMASMESALSALVDLQQEYQDWLDNLPENAQSGSTAEKLEAVCDLDITSVVDDLNGLLDEIEQADLPLGFGRD